MSHPLLTGGTVGLMSGEAPRYAADTTATHENLQTHLKQANLAHEPTKGQYETPENSVIIHNPTREHMVALGKRFGQESVIHSQGGRHELIYTNGPDEGKVRVSHEHELFHQPPEDNYTELPGHGFFRIKFDFSKPPQSPVISKSVGDTALDKIYTPEEAQLELQKATREKVEALAKQLTELHIRELAKAAKVSKSLIVPHKHSVGMNVGAGTEDVPPGKLNPPGKNDPIKSEDNMEKELLCKLCKKSTCKNEACGTQKAELVDLKDATPNPVPESKTIPSPGSGSAPRPNTSLKSLRAKASMKKSEPAETVLLAKAEEGSGLKWQEMVRHGSGSRKAKADGSRAKVIHHSAYATHTPESTPKYGNQPDVGEYTVEAHKPHALNFYHTRTGHQHLGTHKDVESAKAAADKHHSEMAPKTEKAEVPMAKPPSGKNMATHVPTSKPQAPKQTPVAAFGAPVPKQAPTIKGDFGMDDSGKPSTLPPPAAQPAPKPQYTMNDLKAGKEALKKPGIFGKLKKKP